MSKIIYTSRDIPFLNKEILKWQSKGRLSLKNANLAIKAKNVNDINDHVAKLANSNKITSQILALINSIKENAPEPVFLDSSFYIPLYRKAEINKRTAISKKNVKTLLAEFNKLDALNAKIAKSAKKLNSKRKK